MQIGVAVIPCITRILQKPAKPCKTGIETENLRVWSSILRGGNVHKKRNADRGELFSIALFDNLLEQYRNTLMEAALRRIFTKIVKSMPERVTVDSKFIIPQLSVISDHQGYMVTFFSAAIA